MLRFISDVLRLKSYNAQVKAASEGKLTVVFATLNVVDKDRDVTLPGAFGTQTAMFLPAHNWGHPAIGVAKIHEEGNEAIAEIQLYMEMESAREWYESIKGNLENGVVQEFSYGFTIEDSSRGQMDGKEVQYLKAVKVHEVSPVVVGAGENTRTLAVKSRSFRGSWEQTQQSIREAAATALGPDTGWGWTYIEATFDDSVIVCRYEDDGGEKFYQFSWSAMPDGSIMLSDQFEVEIEAVVRQAGKSAPLPGRIKDAHARVNRAIAESRKALEGADEAVRSKAVKEASGAIGEVAEPAKATHLAIEQFLKDAAVEPKTNKGKELYVDMLLSGSLEVTA